MLTGDRPAPAAQIGAVLGLDEVRASRLRPTRSPGYAPSVERAVTAMVGDGVNDAPALAAATVGIAHRRSRFHRQLGGRGHRPDHRTGWTGSPTRWSSRAARDESPCKARRSAWPYRWSRWCSPRSGSCRRRSAALLQEAIDVAVIINALRALRGHDPRRHRSSMARPNGAHPPLLRRTRCDASAPLDAARHRPPGDQRSARGGPGVAATAPTSSFGTRCFRMSTPKNACSTRRSRVRSGALRQPRR